MMNRLLAIAGFSLAAAWPALAQTSPLPKPQGDFEAEFRLTGQVAGTMAYRYAATAGQLRLEMSHQGMAMGGLYDLGRGTIRVWSPAMAGMIMRMDAPAAEKATGTRTSEVRQVLGAECRVWKIDRGEACFTQDGIPLSMSGGGVQSVATRFERKAQAPESFRPPAGQEMSLPIPPGMKIPMPW
jgi:hypothetical protein